jgi:hypothetical protein
MTITETPCSYCGKPLGNEVFLGHVHGTCARKLHAAATGKRKANRKGVRP